MSALFPCLHSLTLTRGDLGEFGITYNFREFSSVNTEKVLCCLYEIILKINVNLKSHKGVYELSSKHTYRPMRARVVAQLFYKGGEH